MDNATKQAALTAVLIFNLIVIASMFPALWARPALTMGGWVTRAVPTVFLAGAIAAGVFYFLKRRG